MKKIRIVQRGFDMIAQADIQGGIYPNHIFLLAAIKSGEWKEVSALKQKLQLADWDECLKFLIRNKCVQAE